MSALPIQASDAPIPAARDSGPVMKATDLHRHYSVSRGAFSGQATLKALDGASFTIERGKTLAVVGESGCGKSTLARMVTMIERPTSGSLVLDGVETTTADAATLKGLRARVQMVFQDPYGSLNPRKQVGQILEEPLEINTDHGAAARRESAQAMLAHVGLRPEHYSRYPHMFSGGQRQRIAIARALAVQPKLLILDEPTSALDVSVQAQILNLLTELQATHGLAYLFITHNLPVVGYLAQRVAVMQQGRIVEEGPAERILTQPRHAYTRLLLDSAPGRAPPG